MLKVGLVGVGAMGSGHLANYLRLMREGAGVQLVAVCDVRPEQMERKENTDLNIEIKQEKFEAHYNKYTDFKEMMAKEEMDYIDFAVPTYLHAQMAIAALENGFHVLSEKPMALNVQQCESMIGAQLRSGKTLMVAQCLRFWPAYEQLIWWTPESGAAWCPACSSAAALPPSGPLRTGCARRTRAAARCWISTSTMWTPSTGSSARPRPCPPPPST